MKTKLLPITMLLLIGPFILGACSDKKEPPAKSAVQKMTEQTAHEIVKKVKTPIDKAHQVVKENENHYDDLEQSQDE